MRISIDELTIEDMQQGFRHLPDSAVYECLSCGRRFPQGEVFPMDGRFYDASHAVTQHLATQHPGYFQELLESDNKYITFTENQKLLLTFIHNGLSDNEIAVRLGVSPSTVRHQKFTFREKAKQAKMLLALYGLALQGKEDLLPVHNNALMVDERYVIPVKEEDQVLENFFTSFSPLVLKSFPAKEKKKIVVLSKIAGQFEQGRRYPEKEVNRVLKGIFDDHVTLRRYLIEYGFFDRTKDCREYWRK